MGAGYGLENAGFYAGNGMARFAFYKDHSGCGVVQRLQWEQLEGCSSIIQEKGWWLRLA